MPLLHNTHIIPSVDASHINVAPAATVNVPPDVGVGHPDYFVSAYEAGYIPAGDRLQDFLGRAVSSSLHDKKKKKKKRPTSIQDSIIGSALNNVNSNKQPVVVAVTSRSAHEVTSQLPEITTIPLTSTSAIPLTSAIPSTTSTASTTTTTEAEEDEEEWNDDDDSIYTPPTLPEPPKQPAQSYLAPMMVSTAKPTTTSTHGPDPDFDEDDEDYGDLDVAADGHDDWDDLEWKDRHDSIGPPVYQRRHKWSASNQKKRRKKRRKRKRRIDDYYDDTKSDYDGLDDDVEDEPVDARGAAADKEADRGEHHYQPLKAKGSENQKRQVRTDALGNHLVAGHLTQPIQPQIQFVQPLHTYHTII